MFTFRAVDDPGNGQDLPASDLLLPSEEMGEVRLPQEPSLRHHTEPRALRDILRGKTRRKGQVWEGKEIILYYVLVVVVVVVVVMVVVL